MARTPKPLQPLDREIVHVLNERIDAAGLTRRGIEAQSGLGVNRIGIILRGEQPPATVGEVDALARLAGLSASDVIALAEDALDAATQRAFTLAASDADIDVEVEAQQDEA